MTSSQFSLTPLAPCESQPYRFRYIVEDGRSIDVPDGAVTLFHFDGEHLWLRLLEDDGMTDFRMDSGIAQVHDARHGGMPEAMQ
jgi:hypothetical protein